MTTDRAQRAEGTSVVGGGPQGRGEAPFRPLVQHTPGLVAVIDAEGSVTNLLDDPEVKGAVVHASDVTDRYAAESARSRSEEALRAIVQSSPLAILALDRRGVVHVWSRACEEMFGFPSADVIGRKPLMVDDASSVVFMALVVREVEG